jgi:hypothetical protein
MTETATRPDGQPERRRVHRAALKLNATIREPGRSRVGVRLIDISTHGCRIETTSGFTPESWVLLSIAGLETQYCRIAWSCEEFAGLEFATPLAEPILDALLKDHQQLPEGAISELREISNRTRRLATRDPQSENETLAAFSDKCAVDAVVEALRLTDSPGAGR